MLCPVERATEIDPADPLAAKTVEANSREAFRAAAQSWRMARDAPLNQVQNPEWLDRFDSCLHVAKLTLQDVVQNEAQFREVSGRTLRKNLEDINQRASSEDVTPLLQKYEKRAQGRAPLSVEEKTRLLGISKDAVDSNRSTCKDTNLSQGFGPVRDQGDMGWCVGYTLADLATFKAKKANHPDAMIVSAADISLKHNSAYFRTKAGQEGLGVSQQTTAVPEHAFNEIIKAGFCSEKDAPSEDFAYGTIRETLKEIERLKIRAASAEPGADSCRAYLQVRELFPGISFEDFGEILKAQADDSLDYFEKLNEKNCAGKRSTLGLTPEMARVGYTSSLDPAKQRKQQLAYMEIVQEQLKKGNPVTLVINAALIQDRQPGAGTITANGKKFDSGDLGFHAINVVGREFDEETKSCRFLLRNSWGAYCSASTKEGLCDEDRPGYLWVKEADLRNNLREYFYLD